MAGLAAGYQNGNSIYTYAIQFIDLLMLVGFDWRSFVCLLPVPHAKDLLRQRLCSISLYCTEGCGGSGMDGSSDFQGKIGKGNGVCDQNCNGGID